MTSFEQIKYVVLDHIKNKKELFLDTNIIINIAENDLKLLLLIEKSIYFAQTTTNINELNGLIVNGRLDEQLPSTLKNFADKVRRRVVKSNNRILIDQLTPLILLIPRSVAYYVVIAFVDKLIQHYAGLLPKADSLTSNDFIQLHNTYNYEKSQLKVQAENRYFELIDKLNINEFDERKYFQDVFKFISLAVSEIEKTVKNSKANISDVVRKLNQFKQKTYNADIAFVAEVIQKGASCISQDSDVLWLFTFHALRAA